MRYAFILILQFFLPVAFALDWEEQQIFKGINGNQTIRVISSTDTAVFAPIISNFLAINPDLNVEYLVAGSAAVNEEVRRSPDSYDLVISSAMDLQLKLVNDGYAQVVDSLQHPDWAQWRQSLFGFTLEPAAIVVNRNAFDVLPIPQSRQQMIEVLRTNADGFRGKIATYDIRQSGLGYLFATQDARSSETFWRLMEIMGSLETKLYCCSGEMIEQVANGDVLIAYNVLGSYAAARSDLSEKIAIIRPDDFPNIMMRTALITRKTTRLRPALALLRYLISSQWSDQEITAGSLPALSTATADVQRTVITLEPGLMVFLDKMKRASFIREWESAIIQ